MSENYKGTIVKISNLRKHNNADRLQCANIFGNNVIVSIDTKEGDLGIFFPLETALSPGFIYANNLSTNSELNKDKGSKGYFGKHGRVKAQTFREEKSMGFWIPISCLDYLEIPKDKLYEGLELDSWKDRRICSKYIPNVNITSSNKKNKSGKVYKKKESKIIDNQFRFHYDTSQLGKNMHRILPDDIISISWKMHGTSAIAANVLCKKKLNWKDKVAKFFKIPIQDTEYSYLYASRKVVKNEFIENKQHYYSHDLWTDIGKKNFENILYQGESVYYEIVGFDGSGGYIQKGFDYGCEFDHSGYDEPDKKPQYKIYVYRITRTTPDGSVIDLDWGQVKERCKELGVEYCPEIYYGEADVFFPHNEAIYTEEGLKIWREEFLKQLQALYVYDQDSQFCTNKVPEEGIVVRKEGLYLEAYKLKSFRFLKYESDQLDEGVVDLETSQSEVLDQLAEQAQELNMGYEQEDQV